MKRVALGFGAVAVLALVALAAIATSASATAITFHLVERFTVSGGLTRVEFERGHLHVFGDC